MLYVFVNHERDKVLYATYDEDTYRYKNLCECVQDEMEDWLRGR